MLHSAGVGALVQAVLPVGKVHKALHKSRVDERSVVERDYPRRLRAQHVVEVHTDSYAFHAASLLHRFVDVSLELGKSAFTVDVGHDLAQGLHTLGMNVKLLKRFLYHGYAAHVLVDLAQPVYERPQRGSLLILLKTRHVLQIGEPRHKILHSGAQLREAQKVLEHVAAPLDDLGIVGDLSHKVVHVLAFVAVVGQIVKQKIDRQVVYRLRGQLVGFMFFSHREQ